MGNLLYCMCDGLLGRAPGSRELTGLSPAPAWTQIVTIPLCSTTCLNVCLTVCLVFKVWSILRGFKISFWPQREFSVQLSWRMLYAQAMICLQFVQNGLIYTNMYQSSPNHLSYTYVVFCKLTTCLTHLLQPPQASLPALFLFLFHSTGMKKECQKSLLIQPEGLKLSGPGGMSVRMPTYKNQIYNNPLEKQQSRLGRQDFCGWKKTHFEDKSARQIIAHPAGSERWQYHNADCCG